MPKLISNGEKGKTRPAFINEGIDVLLAFMVEWQHKGRASVEREIRPILRDYVEMLLYTGMRHGTEAMGIRWKGLEWHTKDGVRYLRVWVDGKTGGVGSLPSTRQWMCSSGYTQDNGTFANCRLKRHSQHGCRTCCSASVTATSRTVWFAHSGG